MLKKISIASFIVLALSILSFVLGLVIFNADVQTCWQIFSITMPLAGFSFWVGVITLVVHLVRNNNKKD